MKEEKRFKIEVISIMVLIVVLLFIGLLIIIDNNKTKYVACTKDRKICIQEYKIVTINENYEVKYNVVNRTRKKIPAGELKAYNGTDDYRLLPYNEIDKKSSVENTILTDEESWNGFDTIKKIEAVNTK